jgi:hypothetical protein
MTPEQIAAIQKVSQAYSGLQYVVTDPKLQWPWTSKASTNVIIDLVRSIPDLLDALSEQTRLRERAEQRERELMAAADELAASLEAHRYDMHQTSKRPCATCRRSQDALASYRNLAAASSAAAQADEQGGK